MFTKIYYHSRQSTMILLLLWSSTVIIFHRVLLEVLSALTSCILVPDVEKPWRMTPLSRPRMSIVLCGFRVVVKDLCRNFLIEIARETHVFGTCEICWCSARNFESFSDYQKMVTYVINCGIKTNETTSPDGRSCIE